MFGHPFLETMAHDERHAQDAGEKAVARVELCGSAKAHQGFSPLTLPALDHANKKIDRRIVGLKPCEFFILRTGLRVIAIAV